MAYLWAVLMITMWIRLIRKYKSEVILNEKNIIVENVDNSVYKLNDEATSKRMTLVK